ncbi:hypothetical protein [Thauera butanivorans]|jgi:hypothetical protein|uniref:hypothetical protein n=1 Tax=Thauera butanivorans TaxID=86174 RepID=UPI000838127A|nr:hypothetical protein [Thauera butanivorans]
MTNLSIQELERIYDKLALAIDAATPQHAELFLVKLAILAAEALGDADRFNTMIEAAGQDL